MSKHKMMSTAGILILVDQFIKIVINTFLIEKQFSIIGSFVRFRPHLNTDYSWINSIANLGMGLTLHVIIVLLILVIALVIYGYIKSKHNYDKFVDLTFSILFAGVFCSLIDKIFWGGSLDYISLKGLFIFDLKDVYITIFQCIIVYMLVVNYKGLRDSEEKHIFRELKEYVKSIR